MLLLTRNIGQSLHIGDGIQVTVIDVKGQQVRLGISAPKDVVIRREELIGKPTWAERTRNGRPDPI